jgi:ribosome-associated toxin RatA of RatAB toxin-antitoxin module
LTVFSCSESILINETREQVYRVAEEYPRFATFYKAGEILENTDRTTVVRITSTLCGIPISWRGHGKKVPQESIEFVQTEGLLKGLSALWTFRDHNQICRVTIESHFSLEIPVVGRLVEQLLGRYKVRKTIRLILTALKHRAEPAR